MKSHRLIPDYVEMVSPKHNQPTETKLSYYRRSLFHYRKQVQIYQEKADKAERRMIRLTREVLYD